MDDEVKKRFDNGAMVTWHWTDPGSPKTETRYGAWITKLRADQVRTSDARRMEFDDESKFGGGGTWLEYIAGREKDYGYLVQWRYF